MPASKWTGLASLLVLLALLAGCGAEQDAPAASQSAQPTQPPATITSMPAGTPGSAPADVPEQLRFSAKTVDGKDFDGASLAGKPTVLWFWAPWCPKCNAEAEGVATTARDNADKVTFVGVAAMDEVPAMQQFVQRYGVDFTHIADTDAAVWRRFGVTVQPAYAFVDSTGTIDVVKRQLSADELADKATALA